MNDFFVGGIIAALLFTSVFIVVAIGYDNILLEQKCKEHNGTVVRYTCIKNTAIVDLN